MKDIIENNRQLNEQIQAVLLQKDNLILTRVSEINQISSEILAKIDFFSGITATLAPNRVLSEQALDIVQTFYSTAATDHLVWISGDKHLQLGHSGLGIQISEPAFLEDDLNQLVRMGLMMEQYVDEAGYLSPLALANIS